MESDLSKNGKKKQPREKPLSLYPMTMDEALRKALEIPPPNDDDKHQQQHKKQKNK